MRPPEEYVTDEAVQAAWTAGRAAGARGAFAAAPPIVEAVIADLLDTHQLHEDTGDPHDEGYRAALEDIERWAKERTA